ncbi:MAG: hypothetical protein M1832_005976 [Thelocarpon impressellum]|nr:MAG: hypothetical protein M1832_005976 [Thelocarpon impressellum]
MVAALWARWCAGGDGADGRAAEEAAATDELRSAREISDSDQLKPSPVAARGGALEDLAKWGGRLGLVLEGPRPLTVGPDGGAAGLEALPLPLLPFPARTSRRARAPKLMRRAKGVVGTEADVGAAPSPSSMTFSSTAGGPEPALDMLSRREAAEPGPKGEVWVGEVPERPSVVMDMRRRLWALAAADAMEPGKAEVPPALLGDRPKRPEKGWPGEKEARRGKVGEGGLGGGVLSAGMAASVRGRRFGQAGVDDSER